MAAPANAAVKLNRKKATLYVGDSLKLKVKGANRKKVKWSSSAKKVAKVSSKGVVKALKPGKAKITARVGKKKFVCRITVKARPVTPEQSSSGTGSAETATPSAPAIPSDPALPSGSGTPSELDVPFEPGTPSGPDVPLEPGTPSEPDTPR